MGAMRHVMWVGKETRCLSNQTLRRCSFHVAPLVTDSPACNTRRTIPTRQSGKFECSNVCSVYRGCILRGQLHTVTVAEQSKQRMRVACFDVRLLPFSRNAAPSRPLAHRSGHPPCDALQQTQQSSTETLFGKGERIQLFQSAIPHACVSRPERREIANQFFGLVKPMDLSHNYTYTSHVTLFSDLPSNFPC